MLFFSTFGQLKLARASQLNPSQWHGFSFYPDGYYLVHEDDISQFFSEFGFLAKEVNFNV